MTNKIFKNSGFTIIEIIITLSILSFSIIGVYGIFAPIASSTYNISNRFTAVYLAQEGFEIIRNLRDYNFINSQNWSDELLACELGCQLDYKTGTTQENPENQLREYNAGEFLMINPDGFYGYDTGGANTIFQRKVTITPQASTDVLRVLVEVTWTYNNKNYNFQTDGYLYNWN